MIIKGDGDCGLDNNNFFRTLQVIWSLICTNQERKVKLLRAKMLLSKKSQENKQRWKSNGKSTIVNIVFQSVPFI